ncbi:hypothetical protein KEHDKFFH_19905 [Marinobacter maroccanus]|uniref:Uncharacterized protein n=1 Tax=Marinobacter maroccanus TaxID=2055143 RepID=A0A2S5Z4V1_9GAMM|nr:hypothetical protein [Marinobacter maroccanus]PPI82380.1 hypothetical protein KEHDKFFH_19905 [Marinobacter maroccanus]
MRTLVQHSLILWLCLLALPASAGFPPLPDGAVVHWSKTGAKYYYEPPGMTGATPAENLSDQAATYVDQCSQQYPGLTCSIQSFNDSPEFQYKVGDQDYMRMNGGARVIASPTQCAALTHEPDPITGNVGSTNEDDCSCATGWVSSGEAPGVAPFDCQIPEQQPEECLENGHMYDPRSQHCVTECPSGHLDNQCLSEPENECDETSPDFEGTIGWGSNRRNVCSGDNQCQDNETYAFRENAEGSWSGQCISNDSNPPVCPNGFEGALIITDGGFACEGLNPEEGDEDTPDGDSDGDGEADTNGMAKQIQEIIKNQIEGNTNTDAINETLKGIGKNIKDGTSAITEAIGNIPGGGGGNGSGGDGSGDGEGDGEQEEPVTWSGDPIDTELTDPTEDYDQVMADYQAKINEIKGEVQAMFSTNLSGGGSVDDNTKTIMGVDVNFSLNRFLPGLDILGAIVLFCAAFISAGILFTSRG